MDGSPGNRAEISENRRPPNVSTVGYRRLHRRRLPGEVVILDILRRIEAATDDQIVTLYQKRAEAYPDVPRVTEQRIRTARAAMVRRGVIAAHPQAGVSLHGNTTTRWRPVASGT